MFLDTTATAAEGESLTPTTHELDDTRSQDIP